MTTGVRTRIAPSPTGPIHIGTVRTALFNYLYARNHGGRFILRLEDTDRERSEERWERAIINELRWLGLDWDEGPDVGGPFAPYRQMDRLSLYREFVGRLMASGAAYECYCSPEEIEGERRRAADAGQVYHYSGRCRELTPAERDALARQGRIPVVRLRVPDRGTVVVKDLVRGTVEFPCKDLGDVIVFRSNGLPVYNFAVVADDMTMNITHVIRAEEHLSNTPIQVLIYEALGLPVPSFAHVGLVLDAERHKLSKRTGDTYVGDFRDKGYLPEALLNFLALLGWTPEGEEEFYTRDQLVANFDLARVARHPAVFDVDKLNWMNARYVRRMDSDRLLEVAMPFLQAAGLLRETPSPAQGQWLVSALELFRDNIVRLAELPEKMSILFGDEVQVEGPALSVLAEPQVPQVLDAFGAAVAASPALEAEGTADLLKEVKGRLGLGGLKVFRPLRVALTGRVHGPELHNLLPVLGKERVLKRLECSRRLVAELPSA